MLLPDAMSCLTHSQATLEWRGAVDRAAQMLAPDWDTGEDHLQLGMVAMTVHTLSCELDLPPGQVSPDAVREALQSPVGRLRARMEAAGPAAGQWDHGTGEPVPPVRRVYLDITYSKELPGEPMGDYGPEPELARQAPDLARRLAAVPDVAAAAPEPTGRVAIQVTGHIMTTRYGYGGGSVLNLRCPECDAGVGGTLTVDGPVVTHTCASGHTHRPDTLAAPHVWRAMQEMVLPQTNQPARPTGGQAEVTGDLAVCAATMPYTAHPLGSMLARKMAHRPS